MDLNAARADIAAKLTAAGVRNVTLDPSTLQPPAVLIDLPRVDIVQSPRADIEIRVRVIAPPPGGADSLTRLLEDLGAVITELRPRQAFPEVYLSGGLECPAYTATTIVTDAVC